MTTIKNRRSENSSHFLKFITGLNEEREKKCKSDDSHKNLAILFLE